jgi:hypothetical protein
LLAGFLARPAFFADLAFLAGARLAFAWVAPPSGVVVFSVSIVLVFIVLLLDRVAVVTIHLSGQEKQQAQSSRRGLQRGDCRLGAGGQLAGAFSFLWADKKSYEPLGARIAVKR